MTRAALDILHAGPQVSMQDAGRFGLLRFGVPASGPMDRFAFSIANLAVGTPENGAVVEVSRGGLSLLCRNGPLGFAVAGGDFQVSINGSRIADWSINVLQTSDTLSIQPGRWGSWCYIAFAGTLRSQPWLGSVATHGPSGLGGGHLVTGGRLEVTNTDPKFSHVATLTCPASARPRHTIRVVLGPQDRFFDPETLRAFLSKPFTLTDAYDRMGVRLSGPSLRPIGSLDMPSEAICRGSVQVAGDGAATVLLADHQTTGGYPKIATILSDDLDGFAQLRSRSIVNFEAVTPQAAVLACRTRDRSRQAYLLQLRKRLSDS